jgi:hypothetical protein
MMTESDKRALAALTERKPDGVDRTDEHDSAHWTYRDERDPDVTYSVSRRRALQKGSGQ